MRHGNKRARAGNPDTGCLAEHLSSMLTAAELQCATAPQFQITRLRTRFTKVECFEVVEDLLQRSPELRRALSRVEGRLV